MGCNLRECPLEAMDQHDRGALSLRESTQRNRKSRLVVDLVTIGAGGNESGQWPSVATTPVPTDLVQVTDRVVHHFDPVPVLPTVGKGVSGSVTA